MIKKNKFTFLFALSSFMLPIIFLTACNSSRKISKDYLYFKSGADTVDIQQKETVIQPNDLLSIQVFSRTINQEQAAIFNIPNTNNVAATGYQVDLHGNIEMPIIGSIKAVGLTKDQLQTLLAKKLSDYVKNPSVLVRFFQFNVNVLGEVRTPGTQKFLVDRVTIIDAIGSAGDLTDYGKREDVTVIREENGKKIFQRVDLRRKDIFESPVYLLQPNDIVYVGANNKKLKALNVDVDTQRTTGLIFSIVSIAATLTSLIVTFSR